MELYEEAVDYLQVYNIPVVKQVATFQMEDIFGTDAEDVFTSGSLLTDCNDMPETPTDHSPEMLLEKRLVVLMSILHSEQQYLSELETLLMPLKALKASAGTSQPVLSAQQLETLFYQIPELRDVHQDFYQRLRDKLEMCLVPEQQQGACGAAQVSVGEAFLRMVSQLGVYRGFIDNYENAVEIVRTCIQNDQRFRTLAEHMMSFTGPDRKQYTLEALLYKPLDRITKTTLVLHDLMKHTPPTHPDHTQLQEALRISSSFLTGVNEESHCRRAVTLSKGIRRHLIRDGFVVDKCEGGRNLRHLFLYTDLLLCTKLKGGFADKHTQYRFCWYLPLAGLRLLFTGEKERPADLQERINSTRGKMYHLREVLRQQKGGKGMFLRILERTQRKLQQCELWLFTHTPFLSLELHSPSGKSHSLLFPSLHELEDWREDIERVKGENAETVSPDLLALTNSCVKLRMTQQPQLHSLRADSELQDLCGTLAVIIHSVSTLSQPASVYVRLEVDGYQFSDSIAQTCLSASSRVPEWDEELTLQTDGSRCLWLLCVGESDGGEGTQVLGRCCMKLEPSFMLNKWKKRVVSMKQLQVSISLKYSPRAAQHQPVYCIPIEVLARQEGVLVPHIVRSCIEEVERRGLDEEGIYRICGAASNVQTIKNLFNSNSQDAVSHLRTMDIHAVSGALKLYFRELPEPLIPTEHFRNLTEAFEIAQLASRMEVLLSVLQSCSDVNRNTFLFLVHHLRRVAERQQVNKMPPMNLATVFGPSLVRPPELILGQSGPKSDIHQEVVVQVQVMYFYLQCTSLPPALISTSQDTEEEDTVDTQAGCCY